MEAGQADIPLLPSSIRIGNMRALMYQNILTGYYQTGGAFMFLKCGMSPRRVMPYHACMSVLSILRSPKQISFFFTLTYARTSLIFSQARGNTLFTCPAL